MHRITITRHGGWAELRLTRPERRNAMDRRMRRELLASVRTLEADHRAVVITGTGTAFCAGLDLTEQEQDRRDGNPGASREEWVEVLAAIRESPSVFLAAVNGWALGGGATLAQVCDLAIAASTARFGYPEIRAGKFPAMAGPTAHRLLNPRRLAWLALTGDSVPAETALAWGLVTELVATPALPTRTAQIAERLAELHPVVLAESKAALRELDRCSSEPAALLAAGHAANERIRTRLAEEVPQ